MNYGYIRVSTREQNEDRQLKAMLEAGVVEDAIFLDKQSGKDFNRSAYQQLLETVQAGDVIFIKSIDRLGRNYDEIIEQWREISKNKGVDAERERAREKARTGKSSTPAFTNLNYPPKICIVCGKEFTPNSPTQKTCSKECAKENRYYMSKKRQWKKRQNDT